MLAKKRNMSLLLLADSPQELKLLSEMATASEGGATTILAAPAVGGNDFILEVASERAQTA